MMNLRIVWITQYDLVKERQKEKGRKGERERKDEGKEIKA